MSPDPAIPPNGPRKAAIILMLLGDDVAIGIYKSLSEAEIRIITQEIADLGNINSVLAAEVLQEFHRLSTSQENSARGGQEHAHKLLVKAFGEEGARALLEEVVKEQETNSQTFDTLQRIDPEQLAKFLQGEHAQTIALVLAHLNTRTARSVLMFLSEKTRGQTVKRMAQMQQFSPEMVKKISTVLNGRLAAIGQQSRRAFGGVKAVADLLNQIEQVASKNILEAIEEDDTQLATSIRNLMFTFEDFLEVEDGGMRELLGQVDKKTLASALKGASEDLKNHFFKCMSTRAAEMLKEDIEALGPMRSRDVQAAQQEIVNAARKLESEGKMFLKSDKEESYVV
ncbi:MAG TPA: flagellar motor switch protein FliG [Candidatus Acidoferrum sp.]|jgi:flagellar motor switch protein FliG